MFKFLVIYFESNIKHFLYLIINKEEDVFSMLVSTAHRYPESTFFPIMKDEDVLRISNNVNDTWKKALLKDVKDCNQVFGVCVRNKCIPVYSIKHIKEDVFNIVSSELVFTSNYFKPCLYVRND